MEQELTKQQTPRDVANQAEAMVINLPQSILMALLNHAFDGGANRQSQTQVYHDQVEEAVRYLDKSFLEDFGRSAGSLDEELASARSELYDAIKALNTELAKLNESCDDIALRKLAVQTQELISPAIGGFLGALFTQVVAYEKASAKRAQDVDSAALSHIEEIARQITFIAINASIEAARAGAVGKAFSVIATEIKSLSEETKKAVDGIRKELANHM